MANHASAIKRHKQSEKRRVRNAATKSALRTAIKKVKEAKPEETQASLKAAVKMLDKAVSKGVLHRNNASRKISRLTAQANPKK